MFSLSRCVFLDDVISGGERREGSAPLITDLLVAYDARRELIPGRSSYTDTDESVVMLTLNS